MPRHCCVPGCKSNYASTLKSEPARSTFSFPKDRELQNIWLRAIHREEYTLTKYSTVCSLHFEQSEITTTEIYKDSHGNTHESKLTYPRLIEGAIPHIFPNQPKYFSSRKTASRRDPEERRQDNLRRQNVEIEEFLTSDIIEHFEDLVQSAPLKLCLNKWNCKCVDNILYFFMLNIDCMDLEFDSYEIKVVSSVRVNQDFVVTIFVNGKELSPSNLEWILPDGKSLSRWSQMENILSRYSCFQNDIQDKKDVFLEKAQINIQNALNSLDNETMDDTAEILELLKDQLKLLTKKRKQYNLPTLLFSLTILNQSASAFDILRQHLTLPTKRHLQTISSSLNVSPEDSAKNQNYFSYVFSSLNPLEKIVCLVVDEIYIKSGLTYKSKNVSGYATNDVLLLAKTVQTFMIVSPFGHFEEVIRLMPVIDMKGNELQQAVLEVINYVQEIGFKIICITTDANRTNQNMFKQFSQTNPFIINPKYPNEKIFFLYDFVHIFKNIRNNWINQKDSLQTFIYPDFNNISVIKKARFTDLQNIYNLEIDQITKKAYKLNHKTLYPNKFERQNVMLVENVFHDSTIAALKSCDTYDDTSNFLEHIKNWWSIVNVKSKLKGKLKRNDFCTPITSETDRKIEYLQNFIEWLDKWHSEPGMVGLTKDTYTAIKHSTLVLINLVKYCYLNFPINYFLPGKFQSDNLEKRFGRYRNLSGCSYNVSFNQVLESEKKIRIQNLLKNGLNDLSILKQCLFDDKSEACRVDIKDFMSIFNSDYLEAYNLDESTQLYVCGYIAHTIHKAKHISCSECKALVVKNVGSNINDDYFSFLQRGGLCIATNEINYIYYHMCAIFDFIINSSEWESKFLLTQNHQNLLVSLAVASLESGPFYIDFNRVCSCGTTYRKIYFKAASTLSNILLNNYTKNKNNLQHSSGVFTKKRKLATLKS